MNQVVRFSKFIKCKNDITQPCVYVQDSVNIPIFVKKYDLKPCKTYNPPSVKVYEEIDSYLWLCLFVGLIDGDGHISTLHKGRCNQIRIKLHGSWLEFLLHCGSRLSGLSGDGVSPAKINNYGYAELSINRQSVVSFLNDFVKKNNLPVLERKWSRIDEAKQKRKEHCVSPKP